jgi:hypothetical protein
VHPLNGVLTVAEADHHRLSGIELPMPPTPLILLWARGWLLRPPVVDRGSAGPLLPLGPGPIA